MKLFTTHKFSIEDCPVGLRNNVLGWKQFNPSFEFEYKNDNEMMEWMTANTSAESLECFNLLAMGAGKADFYRIRKLFVEGGFWFDADLPPIDILSKIPILFQLLEKHKTVIFVGDNTNEPRFMIMVSNPNSHMFEEFERRVCQSIKQYASSKEFVETLYLTGPKAFHKLLCEYLHYEKITQLKVGDSFSLGNISFVFVGDILDRDADRLYYSGYRKELTDMGIVHHYKKYAL